ncbi:MAG: globin [Planctomycetota bacterium]
MNPLPENEVYARIGEDGFDRLTRAFYDRVATDDILRPMYDQATAAEGEADLEQARLRLREFLVQRFGGPTRYSQARGHPRLRMRHMPFAIDQRARDRWIELMEASLEEAAIPSVAAVTMRGVFEHVGTFMINRD